MSQVLWVKSEAFDHGVFNTSVRWTVSKVLDFMVSIQVTRDAARLTRQNWVDISTTRAKPVLSEQEAIAYWHVFSVLQLVIGQESQTVDVRLIGIVLMCQVWSPHRGARTDHFAAKATEMWPAERAPGTSISSPRHSPRGSSPRVAASGQTGSNRVRDNSAALLQFVRQHFSQFVQVACMAYDAEPASVQAEDFRHLGLILEAGTSCSKPLRCVTEGVPEFATKQSLPLKDIKKIIDKNLIWNEEVYPPQDGLSHSPQAPATLAADRTLHISGLHKATWLQRPTGCDEVDLLNITSCNDCVIYIPFRARLCLIAGCHECTIVMGPVSSLCTIQNCEKMTVHVATHCFKMENSIDSSAYLYCKIPPILTGDTRGIKLAPFNVLYSRMNDQLKASSLALEQEYIDVWAHPVCCTLGSPDETLGGRSGSFDESTSSTYHFVHPQNFQPVVIPETDARSAIAAQKLVLPQAYDDALKARMQEMRSYHRQLSEISDEGKRKIAQQVIQGHFREWLQTTGKSRQLHDLARLAPTNL